ncbi:DoxX family protein [Nocardia sp. 2]|uniref:DoxX family protein n=1 Tax=Nocardia acididurans TaxID=2802282 RepID=A0ABS1M4E8_9NOCA|nr:DoxX family protein [Nocardia acididurans]MBL1075455.1 DoxX family protein [Nocardia acididurans]
MFTAFVIVTLVTIALNAAEAVANFARIRFVRNNIAQVGLPESLLPLLGFCKGAGAVGLALGMAGYRPIGVAAAVGLVAFFVCAVVAHIRARVFYNFAGPLLFLGLSVATLWLMLAH